VEIDILDATREQLSKLQILETQVLMQQRMKNAGAANEQQWLDRIEDLENRIYEMG
jgi:hypothetical protein